MRGRKGGDEEREMGECMMQADVRTLPELGRENIAVGKSTSGLDGAGLVMDGHLREGVVDLSDAHVVVILAVCVPAAEGEGTTPATHDTAA